MGVSARPGCAGGTAPPRRFCSSPPFSACGLPAGTASSTGPGCLPLAALLALAVAERFTPGAPAGRGCTTELPAPPRRDAAGHLFRFALGLAGILAGARLLVNSARALARGLGLPESLIAVTIVAIGTSLPELVTTLTAIFKRQSSLSAGNILGANLIDIALILPVCRLVNGGPLPMGAQTLTLDFSLLPRHQPAGLSAHAVHRPVCPAGRGGLP